MSKRNLIVTIAGTVALTLSLLVAYQRWRGPQENPVIELLRQLPADANTVIYVDINALRQSPFLEELYKWAPPPTADPDYAQFVQATGFKYETDLNRVGIALSKPGQDTVLFAVADGRFDRKKISAYALQTGTREGRESQEIFSVPVSGNVRRVSFAFLRDNRMALTNGARLDQISSQPQTTSDAQAWRERFGRLAGSPIFAVVRQDGGASAALGGETPGPFQSPQVSTLLKQLQWITVAGKPDADNLRVVVEAEGSAQTNTRQLSDVINGLLVLAQAGLNDPKVRQQLEPQAREAYLDLLKNTDVSRIDRGATKSVRMVFEVTPKLLEVARAALPAGPAVPSPKVVPNKNTIRN